MNDMSWVVPAQTISYLEADLLIIISVMFVLGFVLIVRYSAKVLPAIVGAVAYLIFGFLGAEVLCMLVMAIPGINTIVLASAVGYSIFRGVVLALMFYAARIAAIQLSIKENVTIGNCMMAGFGNAVGFGIVSGFNYMYTSVMGSTINEVGMTALVEGYTQEEAAAIIASVEGLVHAPSLLYLVLGLLTAIDMFFMVIICIIIYGIIKEKLPAVMHFAAVIANIMILLPSTLLESYSTEGFMMMLLIKLAVLALVFAAVLYTDKTYLGREFVTAGESGYKKTTHLPRMKK